MGSQAGVAYKQTAGKAHLLRVTCCATRRGKAITDPVRQVHYHANLAALVGAWEGYLEAVVIEFLRVVSRPTDIGFSAIHASLEQRAQGFTKRFNTPNWANSRELVVNFTGYDPYSAWAASAPRMNAITAQRYLDDILLVRHAFAHGFSMPNTVTWLKLQHGQRLLTAKALGDVEAFITRLVKATDAGLMSHSRTVFGVSVKW